MKKRTTKPTTSKSRKPAVPKQRVVTKRRPKTELHQWDMCWEKFGIEKHDTVFRVVVQRGGPKDTMLTFANWFFDRTEAQDFIARQQANGFRIADTSYYGRIGWLGK